MEKKTYKRLQDTREGKAGTTVDMTERAARYLVLSGVLEEVKTAPAAKPAPKAAPKSEKPKKTESKD